MLEALICPQCGAPLERGAAMCEYCGTDFVDREAERKIAQAEAEIEKIKFRISEQEMASAFARVCQPGSGGAGGRGIKSVLYAYDRPVLEVYE